MFRILLFFEWGVLIGREREREKGGVEGTVPAFLLNSARFPALCQICHFVPITRRQVIARVGFRHCVQILNYLGFRQTDEVVKVSPHARAIRDVEDEELRSFFYGMSPWQFMLMVAASSVGEELFYRVVVQGAFSDVFLRSTELVKNARGMASLHELTREFSDNGFGCEKL
ncbi:uncharacterized protein LOC110912028 isoform X2 [Helianthus annuus]|uniref:uncharacterized protein LOC110912028 isoform X2 n=1 Tax=Helianthus annuus TaxID=4232 RepID=UPI001652F726|nr:uncharacterized protein LOC110912028 isoform X2 [Helianthus annuus]